MSLFTIAEARAFDKLQLASESVYPDAAITAEAVRISEMFTRICGVAFEPTNQVDTLNGNGLDTILVDRIPVISVSLAETRSGITWTELTVDELADLIVDPSGQIIRETLGSWPSGRRNVRITYSHGYATVPADIKRAALKVCVDSTAGLVPTNMPSRAMSMSDEFGTFRLATPGIGSSITGIPEVDVVLNQMRDLWFRPVVG